MNGLKMKIKRPNKLFIQLIAFIFLSSPCLAQAQTQFMNHIIVGPATTVPITPHVHTHQFSDAGQSTNTPTTHHHDQTGSGNSFFHFYHQHQNQNIDLSSTTDTTKGGRLLNSQSININVGGSQMTVTSNTLLTESEKLAALQVLFTGHQSLLIDGQGSADGGSLTIGSRLSQHLSNLVIPQGVSVIDLSRSGILNLSGNLNDSGSLNLITNHSVLNAFSILASNITVGSGGQLTAAGNLDLFSRSGEVADNGTISSLNGSINISAPKI